MKIPQPDIYKCDICGKENNEDTKIYLDVPVLSYKYNCTEYGIEKDKAYVVVEKFDLCEECLHKSVAIEYANNFHIPGYSKIGFNKNKPKSIEFNIK